MKGNTITPVLLLILLMQTAPVFAGDTPYTITAPPGWTHDTKAMARQNITGCFYKTGTRYNPGELHIYINALPVPETTELDTFIFNDMIGFKRLYKTARYEPEYRYTTGREYEIIIYRMDNEPLKYWQYIGYLKTGGTVYIFVLSTRSPEERAENKADYERLLDSFSVK